MDKAEKDALEIVQRFSFTADTDAGFIDELQDAVAAHIRARDEEIARLKAHNETLSAIAVPEANQLRAERDAATEALYAIADMGEIRPAQRARAALARLPRAVERARLVDAVVAAARECAKPNNERDGHEYMDLVAASKALDAHDKQGGEEKGK